MPNEGVRTSDSGSSVSSSSSGHEGVSFGTSALESGRTVSSSPASSEERKAFLTGPKVLVITAIIMVVAIFIYWRVSSAERREEYTVAAAREQQIRTQAEQLAQQMQQLDDAQQKSFSSSGEKGEKFGGAGADPPPTSGISLPSQRPPSFSTPDITDTIGAPRVERGASIPLANSSNSPSSTSSQPLSDASPLDSPTFAGGGVPAGDPALLMPDSTSASPRPVPAADAPSGHGGSVPQSSPINYRGKSISMSQALSAESSRRLSPPPSPPTLPPPSSSSPSGAGNGLPLSSAAADEVVSRQVSRKPPFGAYIPVRLLGAFSTSADQPSQSYLRFETVRDVVGPNWRVPRGSQWIGQVDPRMFDSMRMGNNLRPPDRLAVRFIGYIDPLEQKLILVGGEVHGEDGNPGLKAERKRVDPRWTYALARVLGVGLDILYQRLATPVWLLPNVGDINVVLPVPIGGRGGFIGGPGTAGTNFIPPPQPQYLLRVTSNQMAYVLVNELPPTMDGRQIQMVETVLQPRFGSLGSPGMGGLGSPGMGGLGSPGMGGLGSPGMGGLGSPGMGGMGSPGMGGLGSPGMGGMGSPGMGGLGSPGMGGMGSSGMGGMMPPGSSTGRAMSPGSAPSGQWTPGMPTDPAAQKEYLELLQMLQSLP